MYMKLNSNLFAKIEKNILGQLVVLFLVTGLVLRASAYHVLFKMR